jgi:hypothetical protein
MVRGYTKCKTHFFWLGGWKFQVGEWHGWGFGSIDWISMLDLGVNVFVQG